MKPMIPILTSSARFLLVYGLLVLSIIPSASALHAQDTLVSGQRGASVISGTSLSSPAREESDDGPGRLVEAATVLSLRGAVLSGLMDLMSLPILRFGVDTGFLAAEGYDAWHADAPDRMGDVDATAITYRSEGVLGHLETQSGMLFLPSAEDNRNGPKPLTWIIYTKGTELKRLDVPSRYAGSESRIGAMIASLGYAVWMPDYPGMGVAPGMQTYCDPGSLARSTLDGLAAARSWRASHASSNFSAEERHPFLETGKLYIMGYSEGGLAALAAARAVWQGHSWNETGKTALPFGLTLEGVYAMGAPIDLTRGFRGDLKRETRLSNPAYTLFMMAGFARAHPDRVDLGRMVRADIRESVIPLLGTDKSADEIIRMIANLRHKNRREIVASDILEPEFIRALELDHQADPFFRVLYEARMDLWKPGEAFPLTLAASRKDGVVPFENSEEAMRSFTASGIADPKGPRLLELASASHSVAAIEALLFATMDIDRAEIAGRAADPVTAAGVYGPAPSSAAPASPGSPEDLPGVDPDVGYGRDRD